MAKKEGGMGFRDLHAFNLVMLAKQAQRLIHENHSLFYRVYKTRYFPNCSFMFVELGNNPSFVWRSLLAARDLIREGSRWQVGDGRSIGVFTHRWLTHTLIPLNDAPPDMKVCELIDHDSRQWDRGKIDAMFSPQTRNEIMSLPLKNLNSQDSVCWMENKAQKFFFRSTYKVAFRLKNQPKAEHSADRLHAWTWKEIWSLNVPPKIRMFI